MTRTYILIDRSGSMITMWNEVESSVNEYLKKMRDDKTSIILFDSGNNFEVIIKNEKNAKLNLTDYHPRGMTPLYDAIGDLNEFINQKNPKKASIMIITDGMENASKNKSKEVIQKIIRDWEIKGYEVTTVGANFDNDAQAQSIGNSLDNSIKVKKGNMNNTMKSLATRSVFYKSSGKVEAIDNSVKMNAWSDD